MMRRFSAVEYFPGKAQSRLARATRRPRRSTTDATAPTDLRQRRDGGPGKERHDLRRQQETDVLEPVTQFFPCRSHCRSGKASGVSKILCERT